MKKRLSYIAGLLIMIMAVIIPTFVYAEEGDPGKSPEPTIEVTGVTLSLNSLSMVVDDTKTLIATISPENATKKDITWSSSDTSVATVDSNGKITAIKAGSTTIFATSVSNTSHKATCEVTVSAKADVVKSSDASVKKLVINNGTLDKTFNTNTKKYTVTVAKDVTKLDFSITTNDSNAKPMIANNSSIRTGTIVRVVITAEDDKTKNTYEFVVEKEKVSLNLKSLKIKGYTLNEAFSSDLLEYTVDIPYEAVDVTVQAATESDDVTVDIKGATNLTVGKNIVSVIVKDSSNNTKTYRITVNRSEEDEREETGGNKYVSSTSKITSSALLDAKTPNHTLKYILVSIGCLILFLIGGTGFYFYSKTSPKKLKKLIKERNETENNESSLIEAAPSVMPGDLEATREFNAEDLSVNNSTQVQKDINDLFDDK